MKLPQKRALNKKSKPSTPLQGRYENIEITGLTHQGLGVAKINNKSVFVEQALPTEVVDFKITQDFSKHALAKPMLWKRHAADRTAPFCDAYQTCGGCDLQHLDFESQGNWKLQNLLDQLQKSVDCRKLVVEPLYRDQPTAYRRRARMFLTKDPQTKQPRLGFKQAKSDSVVDIEQCPILSPALNETLRKARFDLLPLASRQLREVQLAEAENGVWLSSEVLSEQPDNEQPFYRIQGTKNTKNTNDIKLFFDPAGFIQVNAQVNQALVNHALDWLQLSHDDKVLDLFCGVGNFSLPLAQSAGQVIGVEGNARAIELAKHNAKLNQCNNTDFIQDDLFKPIDNQAWLGNDYSVLLLDPGRLGAKTLCENLGCLKPKKILYVSCHSDTLIRDLTALEQQHYRIKRLQLFEMFPQTHHYETMVLLEH
jgi:23S rRNA (uracil1939-C5)-methyltransferase